MADIIPFPKQPRAPASAESRFDFQYLMDDKNKAFAIRCLSAGYRIQRDGCMIAIVNDKTNRPVFVLEDDVFNTFLACWLLVDDPETLKVFAKDND